MKTRVEGIVPIGAYHLEAGSERRPLLSGWRVRNAQRAHACAGFYEHEHLSPHQVRKGGPHVSRYVRRTKTARLAGDDGGHYCLDCAWRFLTS